MTDRNEMLQAAARLWLDPNQRDVAEIRLDDLLCPTAECAIESIVAGGPDCVIVRFEDGSRRTVSAGPRNT